MILEEETFDAFGYWPGELLPKSNKKIIAICDDCGKSRIISKSDYRAFCRSCAVKGERNSRFGISLSKETKKKISKNHADCRGSKGGNWRGGLITIKCEACGKERDIPPSWIRKGGGKYCSASCRRRAQKFPTHHTKPELIFEEICKKYDLPFKYTGDGAFWIKNINPDFVECNGKKIVVEIFGVAFHSPLFTFKRNIPYSQTHEGRRRILREYGWKLIVFWDRDMLRNDAEQFILSELKKNKAL